MLNQLDSAGRKLVALAALNADGTLDDETASAMVALAQNAARDYADAGGGNHEQRLMAEPEENER